MPFNLLFWSALGLTAALIAAFTLLFSATQADLGSVLGATGYVKTRTA
jgi:hypothetical protein